MDTNVESTALFWKKNKRAELVISNFADIRYIYKTIIF